MATKKSRAAGAAIQAYLARHSITQAEFAGLLGVTQSAVSQWILGGPITEENRAKILRHTSGEVPAELLFPYAYVRPA
jgi:transcriptional regulator with XRE-family HTH domain